MKPDWVKDFEADFDEAEEDSDYESDGSVPSESIAAEDLANEDDDGNEQNLLLDMEIPYEDLLKLHHAAVEHDRLLGFNATVEEINLAILDVCFKHHAYTAVTSMDVFAWSPDNERKMQAIADLERCNRALGNTDYADLVLRLIQNLEYVKIHSRNAYDSILSNLASLMPVFIEHINKQLGRSLSGAPSPIEVNRGARNTGVQRRSDELAGAIEGQDKEMIEKKNLSLYRFGAEDADSHDYDDLIVPFYNSQATSTKLLSPISYASEVFLAPSLPGNLLKFYNTPTFNPLPDSSSMQQKHGESFVPERYVKVNGSFEKHDATVADQAKTVKRVFSDAFKGLMPVHEPNCGPPFDRFEEASRKYFKQQNELS